MTHRAWIWMAVAVVGLTAHPIAVSAQEGAGSGATCPPGEEVEGDLGIHGIECRNCGFYRSENEPVWRFLSEPKVLSVGEGSPAADKIRPGDLITAIDGTLITTTEGGRRFANVRPGERVTLTVRRGGKISRVQLVAESRCRQSASGPTPCALGDSVRLPSPDCFFSGGDLLVPDPEVPALPDLSQLPEPPSDLPAPEGAWPSGWFGFGISCNCEIKSGGSGEPTVWSFREPPEIHSVEPGSPADRAGLKPGDVLVEIDGTPLTEAEGGSRFGAVKAGEVVRFKVRSGGDARTVRLEAGPRLAAGLPRPAPVEGEVLRRLLERRQRELQIQQELVESLSRSAARGDSVDLLKRYLEAVRAYREQAAGRRDDVSEAELRALYRELLELSYSPLERNRLRFTGNVGNVDVVVRGDDRVVVTVVESGQEIVIVTENTRIRLKASEQ